MTCEDAFVLINGSLDGENTQAEEARLRDHLEHCAKCRELLQLLSGDNQVLRSLEEKAPADLCRNVMQQIRQEMPRKRSTWKRWTGLAVAAALVLAIGVSQLQPQEEQTQAVYGSRMLRQTAAPQTASYMLEERPGMGVTELAQQVADERSAAVVLLETELAALEECACETVENGCRLFTLNGTAEAEELCDQYDLQLFLPSDGFEPEASYALLLP